MGLISLAAFAQANIDLPLGMLMRGAGPAGAGGRGDARADSVNVIIDAAPEAPIEAYCRVMAEAGGIAVARVAVSDLEALRATEGVKALRRGRSLTLHMMDSRALCNVDPVQSGEDLPQGYEGEGIAIGVIDVGFDPNHAAFDGDDGTRIRYYSQVYGGYADDVVASTPEEIAAIVTDDITMYHATHTSSIAAGGYAGEQYHGAAPKASIVMTAIDLMLPDEACVLLGAQITADKIRELGMPGVMNMSIGSLSSPHDPSNPSARFIDAVAKDMPFCISAGNDGRYKRSIRYDFAQEGEGQEEKEMWGLTYGDRKHQYVTLWSGDDTEFTTEVYLYPRDISDELYGPIFTIRPDQKGEILMADADPESEHYSPELAQFLTSASLAAACDLYEGNGKYYNELMFEYQLPEEDASKRVFLAYRVVGEEGLHIDGYAEDEGNYFYRSPSHNIRDWVTPTADGTISTLVLGDNILSIGACDSNGDATYFTSWGTYQMPDRTLPVVIAPGTKVMAAISRPFIEAGNWPSYGYITIDVNGESQYYGEETGTSMSSPFVAGVIALWLEANPALDVDGIKEVIEATSFKTESYDSDPDPARWGTGIIDAYAGMKYVLANMGIRAVGADAPAPLVSLRDGWIEITTAGGQPFTAALYDLSGRLARQAKTNIPMAGLPRGVYVLSILSDRGTFTQKIYWGD